MFFKHEAFMDVCIEGRAVSPTKEGGLKVYGIFWNLGQSGQSFPIGEDIRLKIAPEDLHKWVKCVNTGPNLREAEWLPLK
jgi:hypothetical protein